MMDTIKKNYNDDDDDDTSNVLQQSIEHLHGAVELFHYPGADSRDSNGRFLNN